MKYGVTNFLFEIKNGNPWPILSRTYSMRCEVTKAVENVSKFVQEHSVHSAVDRDCYRWIFSVRHSPNG